MIIKSQILFNITNNIQQMRGAAYRRKKQIVKFKRRVNIWDTNIWDENNFKSIKASILKGESH